ncbi:MAG: hypothetical protein ACJ8GN_26100 [Longimicrobiaceae bacterium]
MYGLIDADYLGYDIAFSVELGNPHTVRYYSWGRDLDEVEGMAVDGDGELYLFSESGAIRKVSLSQPNRPPIPVVQRSPHEFTSANLRSSDGMIELYDARGGRFVTFDPRTDRLVSGGGSPRGTLPAFDGLARAAGQLYGTAPVRDHPGLFACTDEGCRPACAQRLELPRDLQAIETFTESTLIVAWTSITPGNEILLHVESVSPGSCVRRELFTAQLDRAQIGQFLKPSLNFDDVLRRARRSNRSAEIEAIAVQR